MPYRNVDLRYIIRFCLFYSLFLFLIDQKKALNQILITAHKRFKVNNFYIFYIFVFIFILSHVTISTLNLDWYNWLEDSRIPTEGPPCFGFNEVIILKILYLFFKGFYNF